MGNIIIIYIYIERCVNVGYYIVCYTYIGCDGY